MGRGCAIGVLVLGLLLGACSSGSNKSAATTTSSTTTTTSVTTTTTNPEAAVKAAYLAYWSMIDRLNAAPDPNDPELAQRADEPLLSAVKDQLATQRSQGHTFSTPSGRPLTHTVSNISVDSTSASLTDCYVDGTVEYDASGAILDDRISARTTAVVLTSRSGTWKVTDLHFTKSVDGASSCG